MGEALYFNGDSAKVLDSPAKVEIMAFLEDGQLGFGELVEEMGLAKSTVSNHLTDLERMGLVSVEPHEDDARRKVVRSESRKIGETGHKLELEGHLRRSIASSLESPEGFFKSTVLLLRYFSYTEGLDMEPGLKEAGRLLGSELGRDLQSRDPDGFMDELSEKWEALGLGRLGSSMPYITFKNDFGCETIPGPGVCGFYEGFFEGAMATAGADEGEVRMVDCEASGSSYCRFEVVST